MGFILFEVKDMCENVKCECGWEGTEDDLVYDCIHAEAGRTVWCCPVCNKICWEGKFLNTTANEINTKYKIQII